MLGPTQVQKAGSQDLPSIMGLVSAVHWPHRRSDVLALLEQGHAWCVLDEASSDMLGVAMWWAYGPVAARLGLVIVSPQYQGYGLGRVLMRTVLTDAAPRSIKLLATDQGRPLYEKLGFGAVGRTRKHQGQYTRISIANERIRPAGPDDLPALLSLDGDALGAPRPAIIRHLLEVGEVLVLTTGDRVTGYAASRRFGLGHVIGPIVCEAETDAVALFRAIARPGHLRVDRPMHAETFGSELVAHGLPGLEVSEEMVLGTWPPGSGRMRVFAMASHAWG